jgi:hypothetical protein
VVLAAIGLDDQALVLPEEIDLVAGDDRVHGRLPQALLPA